LRKVDPSRHFPWRTLAARGFGLWCDAPAAPPPEFDARLALQALGYGLADFNAAVRAYRRHFAGDDATAMLHCLVRLKGGEATLKP
jgi:N-acetylmuramoyl-L-alanine amidase